MQHIFYFIIKIEKEIIIGLILAPKRQEETVTTHWKRHNLKVEMKKRLTNGSGEIKNPDQIVRERLRLDLIKNRERINKQTKDKNRKRTARKQKQRK